MKKLRWALAIFSLSINLLISGQISNKFDILIATKSDLYFSAFPETFQNDLNINVPTILGNLQYCRGLYLGMLYSGSSFNYQPGLVIGYNSFGGNDRLNDMYENLNLNTTSIGFINKYNFLKYGHYSLVPYVKLNLYLSLIKLKTTESISIIKDHGNDYVEYITEVRTPPINFSGLLTTVEASIGTESKITDRFYLFLELGISTSHYPDFDAKSPFFSEEGTILFGLQYKILKNKRFYYSK